MSNIIKEFIAKGRPNRPGTPIRPTSITVHNTSNPRKGADAKAHSKFVREKGFYEHDGKIHWVSWHFTVDDLVTIQQLPVFEKAFHAGRGNGTSLGIEICMHQGIDQELANRRAATLIAGLLKDLGIPLSGVMTHKSWTGKACPELMLSDEQWSAFLKLIEEAGNLLPSEDRAFALSKEEQQAVDNGASLGDTSDEPEIDHELIEIQVPSLRPDLDSVIANLSSRSGMLAETLATALAELEKHGDSARRLEGRFFFPDGIDYIELVINPVEESKVVLSGPRSSPFAGSSRIAVAGDGRPVYPDHTGEDSVPDDETPHALVHPPIETQLPLPADGLYGTYGADRRYGIEKTIEALLDVGKTFSNRHSGLRIGIGDISKRGGGPISGHKSHRMGVDVDVRLLRKDRREAGCRYQDAVYSRELTQDLVNTFLDNPIIPVRMIFFNDPEVSGVQPWPNHDNHLHVRFTLQDSVHGLAVRAVTRKLASGASVPQNKRAEISAALNLVASVNNVDPAAIAAIIHTESVWDTQCVTGKYIGLTQVGPELIRKLGLSRDEFLALTPGKQIEAYGTWLDYYDFVPKMAALDIDLGAMPLPRQAAVLQAMQFSPNGKKWKEALAKGNLGVPSTPTKQAKFLGDTSIRDMENYYSKFFQKWPPVYESSYSAISDEPRMAT